jgi:phage terminase small subunit
MTTLTAQQELFAQTVASGESQSDAYRRAYKVRANTKQESIHQSASKLMSDPNVISRVDELRKPIIEKVGLTLEAHLARLEHLSKKAEEAENYGPAVTAETNRGKAAGLYTEKVAVTGNVQIIASALDALL